MKNWKKLLAIRMGQYNRKRYSNRRSCWGRGECDLQARRGNSWILLMWLEKLKRQETTMGSC